jgi:hypothetical protein
MTARSLSVCHSLKFGVSSPPLRGRGFCLARAIGAQSPNVREAQVREGS